jgi:hypothetical protein
LPKIILANLEKEKLSNTEIVIPGTLQLYNYLANLRTSSVDGEINMNFAELSRWCINNTNIPDDEDEPFCVNYQICADNEAVQSDENKSWRISDTSFDKTSAKIIALDRCAPN